MFGDFGTSFEPLLSLQRALDRAMREDFFGLSTTSRGGFPPVSVFREDDSFVLTAELPGTSKDDINLEVKNDLLRIHGERRAAYDSKEVSLHRQERALGRFDRTVKLPAAINAERVSADYDNGILTVRLPLAETAKTRKIAIA